MSTPMRAEDAVVELTLEEACRLCAVEREWVIEHVRTELISVDGDAPANWRFSARTLRRVRGLRHLERDFDANPELAALVEDQRDELARLRATLRRFGG